MRKVNPSSNVTSAAYNNATNILKVEYHGGKKPGRSYLYKGVPLRVYRDLLTRKSPGKHVWKKIRSKYPTTKI